MATLVEKTCTPCRGGIPPLTQDEAETFLGQAPGWALLDKAQAGSIAHALLDF
jgi:4a-hydroxytetrahydrobiopterin dehydratase